MKKLINNFSKELIQLSPSSISNVFLDGREVQIGNGNVFKGEEVDLYFFNKSRVSFYTDDLPHFYGEADVEFNFDLEGLNNDQVDSNPKITLVKLFFWEADGINFLKSSKYLNQIEFYSNDLLVLSIGFFSYNRLSNKFDFNSNGELTISDTFGLDKDVSSNLSSYSIQLS